MSTQSVPTNRDLENSRTTGRHVDAQDHTVKETRRSF